MEPSKEVMNEIGMGSYTHTIDAIDFGDDTSAEYKEKLDVVSPISSAATDYCRDLIERYGICILIDGTLIRRNVHLSAFIMMTGQRLISEPTLFMPQNGCQLLCTAFVEAGYSGI